MSLFEEFTEKKMTVEEVYQRVKPAMERMKREHPDFDFAPRLMVVVHGSKHQLVVADVFFTHYTFVGVQAYYETQALYDVQMVKQKFGLKAEMLETFQRILHPYYL